MAPQKWDAYPAESLPWILGVSGFLDGCS